MSETAQLLTIAQTLFPELNLGDCRRNKRFEKVVQALADNPGASLPEVFPNRSDYNACLNLFNAKECSHENILGAHQESVLNRMEAHSGPVLLLHDATFFDFSGHTTLEDDLGPIGNGGGRGWLAHQTLAVNPANRMVFGLVSQVMHIRVPLPKGELVRARRKRIDRESRLWIKGLKEVGPTPVGCNWIQLGDRGADIYEFLQVMVDGGCQFIVRSCNSRALGSGPTELKAKELLHDRMRSLPATASWELEIPARAKQLGRIAHMSAVSERVVLRQPHVQKGLFRKEPLELNVVRAWEPAPPDSVEPLEWLLLTSEPVSTPDEIKKVCDWYSCRMQIEEYHKVQKSGVGVENYQVQSVKKMAALIAILSVVAVALMNLRWAARNPALANLPAEEFVPKTWVVVLKRMVKSKNKNWTVTEFWVNLARLGGYQKNPAHHPPGWITLWRGWKKLIPIIRYHMSIEKMP